MNITFHNVYEDDRSKNNKFLYVLLGRRKEHQNISHIKMPSYEDHLQFVYSRPYLQWELIAVDDLFVGAWYMSKRYEIGIFILEEHQDQGIGKAVLNHIYFNYPNQAIYANVNDKNIASKEFFKRNGFTFQFGFNTGRVFQNTYVKTTPVRILKPVLSKQNQDETIIPEP